MNSPSRKQIVGAAFTFAALLLPTIASANYPTARSQAAFSYNKKTQKSVLFGGLSGIDSNRERKSIGNTWQWDGTRWIRKFPASSPDARYGAAMVYDETRERLVLFGGGAGTATLFADTWSYKNENWTPLSTATAPPARRGAAMAYDPILDRIVLYGGAANEVTLFDTWTFNGTAWQASLDTTPKLASPSLVYDEERHEVLLLGSNEKVEPEMYRWSSTSWVKISPAHIPPCVIQGKMVFQSYNQKVLFAGATCPTGVSEDDTWEWDGSDWTMVTVDPAKTPGFVSGYSLVYDAERGEAVMFGGIDVRERNTTFRYRDAVWTAVVDDDFSPGPRSLFVFEGDAERNVMWLFGGQNERGAFTDLWKLEGNRWTLIKAEGGPDNCSYPVGTFDSDRKRLVIFCEATSTFEWDGTAWFKFDSVKTRPPTRKFAAMTYDESLKKSVLFGGYGASSTVRSGSFSDYLKDTWTWDGQQWTKFDRKTAPTPRMLSSFFYDPISKKTLLFGGIGRKTTEDRVTRFSDMWTFNGSAWTQIKLVSGPGARYGMFTGFNPVTGTTVMFGGKNDKEQFINDQWEWNGTEWKKTEAKNPPSPRMNGRLDLNPANGKLTLYGGYSGEYLSELWTLDRDTWTLVPEAE